MDRSAAERMVKRSARPGRHHQPDQPLHAPSPPHDGRPSTLVSCPAAGRARRGEPRRPAETMRYDRDRHPSTDMPPTSFAGGARRSCRYRALVTLALAGYTGSARQKRAFNLRDSHLVPSVIRKQRPPGHQRSGTIIVLFRLRRRKRRDRLGILLLLGAGHHL